MVERLFKVLGVMGKSYHGGECEAWSLPHNGKPGEWMLPIEGDLAMCAGGYRLRRERDLAGWTGPMIYEAEWRGERTDCPEEVIVTEARLLAYLDTWNVRTARLWACDCAEHIMPLFERERPDDHRVRAGIVVGRRYAEGKASVEELAAARDMVQAAACLVAQTATGFTAFDVAKRARCAAASGAALAVTNLPLWYPARNTASLAFWNRLWNANTVAAWYASNEWRTQRLIEYLYG